MKCSLVCHIEYSVFFALKLCYADKLKFGQNEGLNEEVAASSSLLWCVQLSIQKPKKRALHFNSTHILAKCEIVK